MSFAPPGVVPPCECAPHMQTAPGARRLLAHVVALALLLAMLGCAVTAPGCASCGCP